VGVVPVRPDPGFGYIQPGDAIAGEEQARRVARFVEKPDRARAETMMREGYLWNSGIFVWRAGDFLDEIAALPPEIAPHLAAHPNDMAGFFAAIRSGIAVDVGVMERSSRVMVLAGDFGWDDVGTWAALRRVRTNDARGNAIHGDVHVLDAANNVVHADGGAVVLYGVHDLVVVSREGLTLVTTTDHAADLKKLIESLPPRIREQA